METQNQTVALTTQSVSVVHVVAPTSTSVAQPQPSGAPVSTSTSVIAGSSASNAVSVLPAAAATPTTDSSTATSASSSSTVSSGLPIDTHTIIMISAIGGAIILLGIMGILLAKLAKRKRMKEQEKIEKKLMASRERLERMDGGVRGGQGTTAGRLGRQSLHRGRPSDIECGQSSNGRPSLVMTRTGSNGAVLLPGRKSGASNADEEFNSDGRKILGSSATDVVRSPSGIYSVRNVTPIPPVPPLPSTIGGFPASDARYSRGESKPAKRFSKRETIVPPKLKQEPKPKTFSRMFKRPSGGFFEPSQIKAVAEEPPALPRVAESVQKAVVPVDTRNNIPAAVHRVRPDVSPPRELSSPVKQYYSSSLYSEIMMTLDRTLDEPRSSTESAYNIPSPIVPPSVVSQVKATALRENEETTSHAVIITAAMNSNARNGSPTASGVHGPRPSPFVPLGYYPGVPVGNPHQPSGFYNGFNAGSPPPGTNIEDWERGWKREHWSGASVYIEDEF